MRKSLNSMKGSSIDRL